MRCRSCRAEAVIDLPRHHSAFCADCFLRHCREQVARSISHYAMIGPGERVLVAVSGGKDSLALWQLLVELGHRADGVYLGLGIAGYSDRSAQVATAFAERRGLCLEVVDLPRDLGFDIPHGAPAAGRTPCSACGLSKRHLFDEVARRGGYDVIATGHNLDDEAAVLYGNVLRWDLGYLARQQPVLPAGGGFVRKVKPLVRLSERETAAYCVLSGIDYVLEECPMSTGNRHLGYKDDLNAVEVRSPGTKAAFYFGFVERLAPLLAALGEEERSGLHPCDSCGAPTVTATCAFCRLAERARV